MKLKNKKTGEIKECVVIPVDENGYPNEYQVFEKGESLAELNEEWEDAPEEPKEYWFIDFNGEIKEFEVLGFEWQGWMKEIGNYFETKEEAMKAVEKLKAFKRLKDKGFEFVGLSYSSSNEVYFEFVNEPLSKEQAIEAEKDLGMLFGGEE